MHSSSMRSALRRTYPKPFGGMRVIPRKRGNYMKKSLFRILSFVLCASLLLFAAGALADDFGGFSGDSDYGFDPGSSYGDDTDFGGSTYDGGGGGWVIIPGGGGEMGSMNCTSTDILIVVIIIVIILLVLWFMSRRMQTPVTTTVQRTDDSMLTPMENYIASADPNFSVVDLQKKLANLYVQLQDNWSARDITPLRPYLTDELYEQSERQLNELRKNEQTPHIERIAVLGTNVRGWFQRDNMDHIIVEMSTRITTYTTDDNTGEVIRGDRNAEKFMTYEWDLVRPTGTVTEKAEEMHVVNCPNCGAPVSINQSAKCPFCDSVITVKANDWVLASIKGLSQRTNR